jgi:hypothetical protein
MIDIDTDQTVMLSIQGACQMTGGLITERKLWQLVKEQQIAYSTEAGNISIPVHEMRRLLGHVAVAA